MKKLLTVCALALALLAASSANPGVRHETALSLSAQAEAYYTGEYTYEALSALAGSASARSDEAWESSLCAALHTLMTETCTALPSYNKTLSLLAGTDASGGSSEPLRFYCDDFGAYNREQVWAEPHGFFYHEGAGRDLHHLRPTDPQANIARGSQTFGDVRGRFENVETWPAEGSPVLWSAPDWNGGLGLVEVRDEIKGDVARILLYVYVCYGGEEGANRNLWTDLPGVGSGLEESDGLRVIESLDTLLEWMALDPVDTWELGRNDAVQAIQGNRNVFIDYPELAFCLFDREIPDMTTPSGLAHGLHCSVSAAADPPEGGSVWVEGHTVTAAPAPGWSVSGWSLEPADAALVEREGEIFTLSALREDCLLTVRFSLTDPCWNGHSWDQGTVTLQPGCETAGERRFVCAVCGGTRTEEIPALGHDWHSQTLPPSCVRPGMIVEACWRCGTEIETPTGAPPLGHSWDQGTVTRPPAKTLPGERTYRCLRCGATRTEEIPFRFVDVADERAYYFRAVYWALFRDPPITTGTDDTHFSPGKSCTRAEVMTFLWRAMGSPAPAGAVLPFTDVPSGAYYYKPVLWAVEQGICSGTSETTFSPRETCTRAQVTAFLWHALGRPEPEEAPELPFTDVPTGIYYYKAVRWAYACGVVAGSSETSFSPNAPCTRAQIVTILWRAFGSE